ncbi:transposable element Tcb2 transposase [Trichonephila clavipes]|nr:transposable element Tcb2 transposase [Trichonephila clavipes]
MWNVTDWQKVVFSDESRFVLGTDDNRVRVWRRPAVLLEHVWDQLKRQLPSCHSARDLELAVQDLWAHLPQDNIRCLINSMPDRVAADPSIASSSSLLFCGSCCSDLISKIEVFILFIAQEQNTWLEK